MKKTNKVKYLESKVLLAEAILGFGIAITALTALTLSAIACKFDNDACGYTTIALIGVIAFDLALLIVLDEAYENEEGDENEKDK